MTILEIDSETSVLLAEMAANEHTTLAQLANKLLLECLEDWQDARAADKAYQHIVDGDAKILSWDEVKEGLYDMDN
jgi:hypothetical protein